MTTSSPEDAPRDMEFLYSGNRLNVAISRARGLAVLVASPELLRVALQDARSRCGSSTRSAGYIEIAAEQERHDERAAVVAPVSASAAGDLLTLGL